MSFYCGPASGSLVKVRYYIRCNNTISGVPRVEQREPAEHPQRLPGDAEPEQREEVREQTQRGQCGWCEVRMIIRRII